MASMESFCTICRPLVSEGYEFYTTAFVKNASTQIANEVNVKDFDETEIVICLDYIDQNDLESKVGINDGTAIYYAMSSNMTLLTTDHITEMVCNTLGVSYVNANCLGKNDVTDITQQPTTRTLNSVR